MPECERACVRACAGACVSAYMCLSSILTGGSVGCHHTCTGLSVCEVPGSLSLSRASHASSRVA